MQCSLIIIHCGKKFILGFQVCFHHIRIYFDLTHYEIKEKTQQKFLIRGQKAFSTIQQLSLSKNTKRDKKKWNEHSLFHYVKNFP